MDKAKNALKADKNLLLNWKIFLNGRNKLIKCCITKYVELRKYSKSKENIHEILCSRDEKYII